MSGAELVPAGEVLDGELVDERDDGVQHLVEQWIESRAYRSEHTERAYRRDVGVWLSWCSVHGVDPLGSRLRDGDRFIAFLAGRLTKRGRPPAKASQARTISAVASFYDFLLNREYVERTPIRTDGRPAGPKHSTTVGLSVEESARLRKTARKAGTWERALIDVLIVEGLRVAELAALRVGSYSWNMGKRTLVVVGKGDKRREVLVERDVRAAIDAHLRVLAGKLDLDGPEALDADALMFPSGRGGQLSQQSVMRTVQRLAKQARIPAWPHLSPHSLRHTCVTNMLDAKVPIERVKEQVGHEDISTTLRYDRARTSLERSGMGAYEQYLRGVEESMGDSDEAA